MKRRITSLLIGMLLAGLTGCQRQQAKELTEAPSAEEPPTASVRTVSVGDTEMDYAVFGSGKQCFVILPGISVHSVMGSADAIAEAYQAFSEAYTVYVFDRVKDIKSGYTVRDMAEDTAVAMQALNLTEANVFGASQGGMIALCLAIDHPEMVHKMILGSTLAKANDTCRQVAEEWIQLAKAKDEEDLLAGFADKVYSEATLKAYREALISSNRGISDEEYQRFISLAEACVSFDCYDELSAIQCPVLVLGSEGDQVVTAEGSKQISEALGCEIHLYDDSYGHGVYDEASDYKQRCIDFLHS